MATTNPSDTERTDSLKGFGESAPKDHTTDPRQAFKQTQTDPHAWNKARKKTKNIHLTANPKGNANKQILTPKQSANPKETMTSEIPTIEKGDSPNSETRSKCPIREPRIQNNLDQSTFAHQKITSTNNRIHTEEAIKPTCKLGDPTSTAATTVENLDAKDFAKIMTQHMPTTAKNPALCSRNSEREIACTRPGGETNTRGTAGTTKTQKEIGKWPATIKYDKAQREMNQAFGSHFITLAITKFFDNTGKRTEFQVHTVDGARPTIHPHQHDNPKSAPRVVSQETTPKNFNIHATKNGKPKEEKKTHTPVRGDSPHRGIPRKILQKELSISGKAKYN